MGARGPLGASKQTLKLRGDSRHRHRPDTLALPVARPTCPDWLPDEAKKLWQLISAELEAAGAVARVDVGVLTIHCAAWAEYIALTQRVAALEAEEQPDDPEGKRAWHLRISRDKAADQLQRSAVQLGLTPASRGRIRASGAQDEDESADPLEMELRRRERL